MKRRDLLSVFLAVSLLIGAISSIRGYRGYLKKYLHEYGSTNYVLNCSLSVMWSGGACTLEKLYEKR